MKKKIIVTKKLVNINYDLNKLDDTFQKLSDASLLIYKRVILDVYNFIGGPPNILNIDKLNNNANKIISNWINVSFNSNKIVFQKITIIIMLLKKLNTNPNIWIHARRIIILKIQNDENLVSSNDLLKKASYWPIFVNLLDKYPKSYLTVLVKHGYILRAEEFAFMVIDKSKHDKTNNFLDIDNQICHIYISKTGYRSFDLSDELVQELKSVPEPINYIIESKDGLKYKYLNSFTQNIFKKKYILSFQTLRSLFATWHFFNRNGDSLSERAKIFGHKLKTHISNYSRNFNPEQYRLCESMSLKLK